MLRFAAVGCLNTLLTLAVIGALMHWGGADYRAANAAGYVAGVVNSFVWNKLWVFRTGGGRSETLREAVRFLVACAAAYAVQYAALCLLVERLGAGEYPAQLAGMAVYTAVNYLMNRLVTFRIR